MIPFIRSLSELMAITESRDRLKNVNRNIESYIPDVESLERKRPIRSLKKKEVKLPNIPKTLKSKWMQNKKSVLRFIDDLDYNNQIQSSFDLTLIDRQNKRNRQDAA